MIFEIFRKKSVCAGKREGPRISLKNQRRRTEGTHILRVYRCIIIHANMNIRTQRRHESDVDTDTQGMKLTHVLTDSFARCSPRSFNLNR